MLRLIGGRTTSRLQDAGLSDFFLGVRGRWHRGLGIRKREVMSKGPFIQSQPSNLCVASYKPVYHQFPHLDWKSG